MSELRHDPLTDRWVVISAERNLRPVDFHPQKTINSEFCPFCPGNEDKTPLPEIYAVLKNGGFRCNTRGADLIKDSDWVIRVIPNKYPALKPENILKRKGIGIFDKISGVGAHEIFIESREHLREISSFTQQHVAAILNTIKLRMNDLEKDPRFRYLSLYKNSGENAGASLEHPHFQLNALPITPLEVARELRLSKSHYDEKERCLICDILLQEIETGERIVEINEAFVVLAPFASRFASELFIAPSPDFHSHSFSGISREDSDVLAPIFQRAIGLLVKKYGNPDYNIILHTSPFFRRHKDGYGETIKEDYHWHFHILPRINKVAGFEFGNDCYINGMSPEDAAKTLREAAV